MPSHRADTSAPVHGGLDQTAERPALVSFDAILRDGSAATEVQPQSRRAARQALRRPTDRRRRVQRAPVTEPVRDRRPAAAAPQPAPAAAAPATARRVAESRRAERAAGRAARQSSPRVPARPEAATQAPRRPRLSSLSAPQVGIAGALGLATIAAPIGGLMSTPAPKTVPNSIAAVAMAPAPAFPRLGTTALLGVETVRVIPVAVAPGPPALLAAPDHILVSNPSGAGQQPVLPGCTGIPRITNAPNGELPLNSLCTLWDPRHRVRADAAVALAKLNIAYRRRFGQDICLTDSYRTLSAQRRLKAIKPGLAATPGTSEHGWGLAVDLCGGVESGTGSVRYQWLRANGPAYGWDNPDWARGGYEPWHWEYTAGVEAQGTAKVSD